MANATDDRLSSVEQSGFGTSWDWKGQYTSQLAEEGLERFSQFSATPDTTMLYAGTARYTGLVNGAAGLRAIGLADNVQMQSDNGVIRLFEMGSNRSFFTVGKTQHALSMTKLLADQASILAALTEQSYRPNMNIDGFKAAGPETPNPAIQMNLGSEVFAVPFGLLLVFKTRGGNGDGYGKMLSGLYLEYCMFQNYSFGIANSQPVIAENVQLQFDRVVPVSFA